MVRRPMDTAISTSVADVNERSCATRFGSFASSSNPTAPLVAK